MKKILLWIMLFTTLAGNAQHKPFQFGFRAGGNLGWFGSSEVNYVNKGVAAGASWGFVADFFIMENYAFTTGFDMVFLNGKLEYPDEQIPNLSTELTPGIMTRKYRMRYIELPAVLTMKTNEINGIRYFGQIGVGIAFRLSAKGDDLFLPDNSDVISERTHDVTGDTRLTRESLILGAGVEIPINGDTYLRTGLKYDNAFLSVLKGDNAANPTEKNSARNSYLELNLAIIF